MIIGILKEPAFENRVSLIPEAAKNLIKLKAHILVETNAGAKAMADDAEYVEAGAKIASREELMKQADISLNRKVLADLAVKEPQVFTAVVSKATAGE